MYLEVSWLWQRTSLRIVSQNDTDYLSTVTLLCVPGIINCCKH